MAGKSWPSLFRVKVDGHDEAVETEDFGENEDEDHSDEESRLLRGSPDSGVADDADGVSGSQPRQADGQTSAEVNEAPEKNASVSFKQKYPG